VLLAPRAELEAAARAVRCMDVLAADPDVVERPLAVWEAAVSAALARLGLSAVAPDGPPWAGAVGERVVEVLVHLYAGRRLVPVSELLEGLWSDIAVERDLDLDDRELVMAWLHGLAAELEVVLDHLTQLGVIDRPDASTAALTDLGVWAVNRLLVATGVDAPVAGEWADSDAEALLSGIVHLDRGHADLEVDLWAERRGDVAVTQLAAVARATLDPAVRAMAFQALDLFGEEADDVVAAMATDPALADDAARWAAAR
jgi:hypothetical protein